jgi:sarcosine oxidase
VAVRTGNETFRADHVVLAAGAWLPGFLPAAHARRLTVTRQTLHWFAPPADASAFEPARMPVFIWNDLYGFPIAAPGGGVKVATEALDAVVDPDAAASEVSGEEIGLVMPRVRAAFPMLGRPLRGATCLYTSTPDFNFWIGPHPQIDNVTVASACSGHGFKHAPAVGEAVVANALGKSGIAMPEAWRTPAVSPRG